MINLGHCNVVGDNARQSSWETAIKAEGFDPSLLSCTYPGEPKPEDAIACFTVRHRDPICYVYPIDNTKARPLSSRELDTMALDQLLLAYSKGERQGHVEWEDLDIALDYAKAARPGRYEEIVQELAEQEENAQ